MAAFAESDELIEAIRKLTEMDIEVGTPEILSYPS
jgi:hypothetical protein